jgi:hypothetical protein
MGVVSSGELDRELDEDGVDARDPLGQHQSLILKRRVR